MTESSMHCELVHLLSIYLVDTYSHIVHVHSRDVHEHLESLTERLSSSQAQFMLAKVIDRLLPLRTRPFYATAKRLANTHMKHTVNKILRLLDVMEEEIAACFALHAPELVQADYPHDVNEAGPQQPLLADEPITENQQDNTSTYGPEEHHVVQGENTTTAESTALSKSLRQIALDLLTPYTFFITPLLIGFLIWKAYATKHLQPVANTLDWIISIVFVSVYVSSVVRLHSYTNATRLPDSPVSSL